MTAVNNNLQVNTDYNNQNAQTPQVVQQEKVSLFENERCTDGKDDGSVGGRVAAKNFLKGAVKSVTDGIKGMFTNDKGEFSVGKTLLSAGVVAGCILFPPAGYALCALGALNGGYHAIKGVGKALLADNDAEAKLAWQEAGGGVATGLLSRAGMKASRTAMQNVSGTQSTAGNASTAQQSVSSAKESAKSLVSDVIDSTANSVSNAAKLFGSIKKSLTNAKDKVKDKIKNTNLSDIKDSAKNATSNINKDSAKNYINDKIDNFNPKKLTTEAYNAIVDALANGKSVKELVGEYGYENVAQVIKLILGEEASTEAIFG